MNRLFFLLVLASSFTILCTKTLANDIALEFVLSRDIAKNSINEAQAKFKIILAAETKDSAWLQQRLRDEVKPIIDEMNAEIVKLVSVANESINKKGTDETTKQQAIFDLNSKFDVIVEFTKSAVEYELQQKLLMWENEKKELKNWKIKTTYEIVRDVAANSFTLATTITSQGATGPIEVIDFLKRTKRIGINLKDSLISEVSTRKELEDALLKYIDDIAKINPSTKPSKAKRFQNLFTESAEVTFEKKILLYEYKLIGLQISLEKMSTRLTNELNKNGLISDKAKLEKYEQACDSLIAQIQLLSKERLEVGRDLVKTCKQIHKLAQAQRSKSEAATIEQIKTDHKRAERAVDVSLSLASLIDPVTAALTALEIASDAIIGELTKPNKPIE